MDTAGPAATAVPVSSWPQPWTPSARGIRLLPCQTPTRKPRWEDGVRGSSCSVARSSTGPTRNRTPSPSRGGSTSAPPTHSATEGKPLCQCPGGRELWPGKGGTLSLGAPLHLPHASLSQKPRCGQSASKMEPGPRRHVGLRPPRTSVQKKGQATGSPWTPACPRHRGSHAHGEEAATLTQ